MKQTNRRSLNSRERGSWEELVWAGSVALLAGFWGLYFGSMVLFHFGLPLGIGHMGLFLLPSVFALQILCPGRRGWVVSGFVILMVLGSYGAAVPFKDFSYDGMATRQALVESLVAQATPQKLYAAHLISGWMAMLGGVLEGGKGVNLLAGLAAFGCCLRMGREFLIPREWGWILSATAALNPVWVYQLSSFYVDGFTAALLTCLVCGYLWVYARPDLVGRWFFLAMVFMLNAAAKPSGLVYGCILGLFFLGSLFFKKRWKASQYSAFAVGACLILALASAALVFQRGQIHSWSELVFLSDLRSQGVGIGPGSSPPENIVHMGKAEAFFRSHFAPTRVTASEWSLKMPFWFIRPELAMFEDLNADPRSGGFGPLYGAAFLLAVIASLFPLLQQGRPPWISWLPAFAILTSCLLSQAWWARWVPQGWLVPLLMAAPLLSYNPPRLFGVLARASITVALLNSILILAFYTSGCWQNERVLRSQLRFLQGITPPILIHIPTFPSNETWLQDAGIRYQLLTQDPPRPRMILQRTNSKVALPEHWEQQLDRPSVVREWRKRKLIED